MGVSANGENEVASLSHNLPIATVASDKLLRGRKTLIIQHGEAIYRLQVTRSNKLILTK
jgi:hemin uptake protein HemP